MNDRQLKMLRVLKEKTSENAASSKSPERQSWEEIEKGIDFIDSQESWSVNAEKALVEIIDLVESYDKVLASRCEKIYERHKTLRDAND